MAGDKTEKATPKKVKEARDKGQVAKSADLAGAGVLLAGVATLGAFGGQMTEALMNLLSSSLNAAAHPETLGYSGLMRAIDEAAQVGLKALLPILGAVTIAAIALLAAQVKLKITPKAIKPDFKKINPLTNAKQVFGMNALVELVKNLAKVGAVAAVVAAVLLPMKDDLGTLIGLQPQALGGILTDQITKVAKAAAAAYFVIGAGDYVWQKYRLDKSLKMDKQEVKEEYK
ncbi:MAG: EscU/YscU/HrcU family type III secretion system export apparatus switch protein, partial [Patulibacter minatonensis]